MRISFRSVLVLLISLTSFLSNTIHAQTDYGITVFGTDHLTKVELTNLFGDEIEELNIHYQNNSESYDELKEHLIRKLQETNEYSYVNFRFFTSYTNKVDFILDVVEKEDAAERLNFREVNTTIYDDPDGVIELWEEYEDLSFELFEKGEITDMSCPVIHCIWSFNHSLLDPYLTRFNELSSKHREELITILNRSSLVNQRAAASFLLAHTSLDPQLLLNTLMPSIKDSESVVRNNSMRVIYYLVRANPDLEIDINKIINVLDFPSFTDRNKALVVLRSLPLQNVESESLERMVSILIEILEKKDAHNFRNALLVLQKISGLEYSDDQISEWTEWAKPYID
ncbi:MAG: hypothetical protein JJ971_11530 [Balneolaceae bacterium]|nr:hypothetical protein [Balneolaceae bacterium]MBO6547520.1 hypothetical protein [Balneolaceae bacterium]MBO6647533.1 hypothetical protein [Balneolaceae bacterium]